MEMRHGYFLKGFTLIEVILGLVIISIALSGIISVFFSFREASINPIFEAKASMLADHVISRIYAVSYDENSDHNGSECRCGESSVGVSSDSLKLCPNVDCSKPSEFGPDTPNEKESTTPDGFNDVDDFDTNLLCSNGSNDVKNLCGGNLELCGNSTSKCIIQASFFTTAVFGDWIDSQKSVVELYDVAYKDFYVYIHVSQNSSVTTINGKDYLGILKSPILVNGVYPFAQIKTVDLAIVTPQGSIYKYRMLRGNY